MVENMREPDPPSAGNPGGRGKAAEDRRCPDCGIKLSSYNPGPHCWAHTVGWPWRGPSAKPRF